MKTPKAKFTGILVVVLVALLGAMANPIKTSPNLEALVGRGMELANADPAAKELRDQQPDDSARRGFDMGIGVAEIDTLPGPVKQRIHDSLPGAEQSGYEAAVSYSLARNRKKLTDLAPKGAELATRDPFKLQNYATNNPMAMRV